MNLGFMQNWPKSMAMENIRTFFIAKIWMGIPSQNKSVKRHEDYADRHVNQFGYHWDVPDVEIKPKLHTIRQDESNRWKVGMNIHFVINIRSKNRFQFAPMIPVVSVQDIEIEYINGWFTVRIDGRYLKPHEIAQLAFNDGFNSIEHFKSYFKEDFKGKLIHWTNIKY